MVNLLQRWLKIILSDLAEDTAKKSAFGPNEKVLQIKLPQLSRLLLYVTLAGLVLTIIPALVQAHTLNLLTFEDKPNPVPIEGFYTAESNGTDNFRWTNQVANLSLPQTLTPRKIRLEVIGAYPPGTPSPHLHLLYQGQELGQWEIPNQWTNLELDMPNLPQLVADELVLKIDNPLLPGKKDGRILGVAVRRLELDVSRIAPVGVILTMLGLGLLVVLAAFWLNLRPRQILLTALTPMLILAFYWHYDPLTSLILIGWVILGAVLIGLFTLYSRFSTNFYLKLLELLPVFVIVGFAVGIYLNSVSYGFYSDDYHIARPWGFGEVLGTFAGSWDPLNIERPFYRPITVVSYALDFLMWGYEPAGYHIVNLILNALNGLLLYRLLRKVGMVWTLALGGAIFFLVLPPNAATPVWISQRSDALVTFFVLAGVLVFHPLWRKPLIKWLVPVFVILAIGSKEVGVVLPVLLVLYYWLFYAQGELKPVTTPARFSWKVVATLKQHWQYLSFLLVSVFVIYSCYLLIRVLLLPIDSSNSIEPFSLFNSLNSYSQAIFLSVYGLDKILPIEAAPWITLGLAGVFIVVLMAPFHSKGHKTFCFGLGWMLITGVPLSLIGLAYKGGGVTPRLLYLSEIGYSMAVVGLLALLLELLKSKTFPRFSWVALLAASCLFFGLLVLYQPVSAENEKVQADYAPYSFLTLERDKLIYESPYWKAMIPARQYQFIEDKLKFVGILKPPKP